MLEIAGKEFRSRLLVGTGKYRSNEEMVRAIAASGAEVVTVAVRRVNLDRSDEAGILHHLGTDRYFLLSNTAGCYTADEAIRTLHLARELGMDELDKLEVIGDPKTLFPDNAETVIAAARLVKEGFSVEHDPLWGVQRTRRIEETHKKAGRRPVVRYFAGQGHVFTGPAILERQKELIRFLETSLR